MIISYIRALSTTHPYIINGMMEHSFTTNPVIQGYHAYKMDGIHQYAKLSTVNENCSIVGKVNISTLLLQTILYQKWGYAVMDYVNVR